MSFQDLVTAATVQFPSLEIKYKDQSTFMKILGGIMFFNPDFMTDYITTIGDTVYFPTVALVTNNEISSSIILMHELVHINDQQKYSKFLFAISYLFPQILFPFCAILFFFIHWYIALPIMLLFMSPLPASWRMNWEKRAYIAALYVQQKLSQKLGFNASLATQATYDEAQFNGGAYYFMWPFGLTNDFNNAIVNINAGQRPYSDPIFDVLDKLIPTV